MEPKTMPRDLIKILDPKRTVKVDSNANSYTIRLGVIESIQRRRSK